MINGKTDNELLEYNSARMKAFDFLSRRTHSVKELREKLKRHFEEPLIQEILDELLEENLLDDEKFALERANFLARKHKSAMEITADLCAKGVDRHTAQDVISQLEDYSEQDECTKIIQKSYMRKLQNGESQKVLAALMRRGFSYRVAKNALETALQNPDDM